MLKYGISLNDRTKGIYYLNLVNLYKKQNRLLDVEKTYIDIKNSFKSTQYYYFLEEFYYIHKRYTDLEKLYKEKLLLEKLSEIEKFTTYNSLAIIYLQRKDLKNAENYFENSYKIISKHYQLNKKIEFIGNYLTFKQLKGIKEDEFIKIKSILLDKYIDSFELNNIDIQEQVSKIEFNTLNLYKFSSLNEVIYDEIGNSYDNKMSYTLSLNLEEAKKDNPKLEDIPPTNN